MQRSLFVLMVVVSFHSFDVDALTVEEAYAAIPHHRTVFDSNASRLPRAQVETLKQLFSLSDRGTVLRVEAMLVFREGRAQDLRRIMDGYRSLVGSLSSLNVTPDIKPIHALLSEAIQAHQHFFEAKLTDPRMLAKRDLSFTSDVHQSSEKLRRAYDLLMKAFPNEPNVNKAAFYDYLCALDFL